MLVFANKQDLPNAMSAAELTDKLQLNQLRNRHVSKLSKQDFVRFIEKRNAPEISGFTICR